MTAGSHNSPDPDRARILVLGLGNPLLSDDGLGLRLLEAIRQESDFGDGVEFVDGGTQGLALLGYLADRDSILVLDAIALGAAPGTVHVLRYRNADQFQAPRASTAHEGNALELFNTARLLGENWSELVVIGIEPKQVATGTELSTEVGNSLQDAASKAKGLLLELAGAFA